MFQKLLICGWAVSSFGLWDSGLVVCSLPSYLLRVDSGRCCILFAWPRSPGDPIRPKGLCLSSNWCRYVVDFELSYCDPRVVVYLSPYIVACALHVVVVWVVGGEIDDFLGIVCHSSGLSMTVRCRDFLLSLLVGPSVW